MSRRKASSAARPPAHAMHMHGSAVDRESDNIMAILTRAACVILILPAGLDGPKEAVASRGPKLLLAIRNCVACTAHTHDR
jgi:hypothetical protein